MDVSVGGSSQVASAPSASGSGRASSADRASWALASAARTIDSTSSRPTLLRETTPAAVPSCPPMVAITVRVRPRVTPLVVRVLPAQRRLASLLSSAITTQPSAVESSSARSASSCGRSAEPVDAVLIGPPPPRC